MDYSQFYQHVQEALLIVVVTGAVGAATAEFVKQVAKSVFKVKEFSSEAASIIAGVVSGSLCIYIVQAQGAGWFIAAAATLVALYAPQPVHDTLSALKKPQK